MAADQLVDLEIQAFRSAVTGLRLQDVRFLDKDAMLLCDISTGQPCSMVPAGWRCCVFDAIHTLSHPGMTVSVKLVGAKFVWLGRMKVIREWAAGCVTVRQGQQENTPGTVSHSKEAFRPH